MPSVTDRSDGSFVSLASTVEYGQVPFAEFSWQVHELCKKIWPASYHDIHIQYLRGGSTNRIFGLSFSPLPAQYNGHVFGELQRTALPSGVLAAFDDLHLNLLSSSNDGRYILRIARFEWEDIARGIASLDYVSQHTSIPVPKVITYDLTAENAVGSPYSLQYRAPGMPLYLVHPTLSYRQQQDLVKEVARILLEFRKVESPFAGSIGYLEDGESIPLPPILSVGEGCEEVEREVDDTQNVHHRVPRVLHYQFPTNDDLYNGKLSTLKNHNAFGIISFHLARLTISKVPADSANYTAAYTSRLLAAAREMDELGCFGYDNTNKLYHDDFESRNIMITVDNDEYGTLRISSILDWDDTIFAPPFVSSLPPRWLWSDVNCNTNEEPQVYEDPVDPVLLALKKTFDVLVGWKFTMYAYEPQYRLARRMFRFAFTGFFSNYDYEAADLLLSEWEELRPKLIEERNSRNQSAEASEESEDDYSTGSEEERGSSDE